MLVLKILSIRTTQGLLLSYLYFNTFILSFQIIFSSNSLFFIFFYPFIIVLHILFSLYYCFFNLIFLHFYVKIFILSLFLLETTFLLDFIKIYNTVMHFCFLFTYNLCIRKTEVLLCFQHFVVLVY